ncbi:MAG: bifunctional diguanylate cyclase/phosphodiesterase [Ilumatobacteraceae bacterium]|nr:bifunctional diguanylate cyclase/phosphodiesterase [Ilumatobacter sp.]MCB0985575.1 bifunctional diguanylate cyclase/phosphodiesterase [Ilumatobacter sp.]
MTYRDDSAIQFAHVAQSVVKHLSATTGLPTWVLVRDDGGGAHALAAHDPSDSIRAAQLVPIDVGMGAPHRVETPIALPDRRPFGRLIGYGQAAVPPGSEVAETAQAFALVLGALAASEMTLLQDRRQMEVREALYDPLTGLATRQGWEQRLRRDEHLCADFGETAAVIIIELDELKLRNEQHGHSAGDEQLRLAGTIVRGVLGERHYGARVTGDRIGVLMVGVGQHEVGELERELRHTLASSQISALVGVGHRQPDRTLHDAVAAADSQLEASAAAAPASEANAMEAAEMLGAIERGEIGAYFQPVVDLRTGEVVAVEALARWWTPEGVREPDRFLQPLGRAGLLGALFDRILDDGLAHLSQFRAVSPNLRLAVNIEFDSKADNSLLSSIVERLQRHGIPAEALSIELSERQTFELTEAIRNDLIAVADLGVQLMLDDFGTGFASLETLTSLPISGVKLDRRFTGQVVNGDREPVVVKAMIAMAAEAGLSVIAEGIETQLQCDRLVRMGCRLGQGYLFALPQPAESVAAVLSAPLVSLF